MGELIEESSNERGKKLMVNFIFDCASNIAYNGWRMISWKEEEEEFLFRTFLRENKIEINRKERKRIYSFKISFFFEFKSGDRSIFHLEMEQIETVRVKSNYKSMNF